MDSGQPAILTAVLGGSSEDGSQRLQVFPSVSVLESKGTPHILTYCSFQVKRGERRGTTQCSHKNLSLEKAFSLDYVYSFPPCRGGIARLGVPAFYFYSPLLPKLELQLLAWYGRSEGGLSQAKLSVVPCLVASSKDGRCLFSVIACLSACCCWCLCFTSGWLGKLCAQCPAVLGGKSLIFTWLVLWELTLPASRFWRPPMFLICVFFFFFCSHQSHHCLFLYRHHPLAIYLS